MIFIKYKALFITLLLLTGGYGIYRTGAILRHSESRDMPNRVAGARLMKDHIVPYYYQRQPGDPLRYIMERDIDTTLHGHGLSPATASPFFHRVLIPFSGYRERTIEQGFVLLFYLMFAAVVLVVIRESRQPLLSLFFAVAFLFTDGWCMHILVGQYYFLFGFLFFAIACALIKKQYYAAGILLALLVLFRLNAVLFALPFAFVLMKYRKYALTCLSLLAAYGIFCLSSPFERENWKDYFHSIRDFTAMQLKYLDDGISVSKATYNIDHLLPRDFEGEDHAAMLQQRLITPEAQVFVEQTNFFMPYKSIFHHAPSAALLNLLLATATAIVMITLYWLRKKKWGYFPPEPLLLAGLLLYECSCFFSPVNTFAYQMVQWLPAVALTLLWHQKTPRGILWLYALAMLICNVYLPGFPGKHYIPEMIFMAAIFLLIVTGRWAKTNTGAPSIYPG